MAWQETYYTYTVTVLDSHKAGGRVYSYFRTIEITCEPDLVCKANLTPEGNSSSELKIPVTIFKLREIPDVMIKKGWLMAAKVQNAWFEGKPYAFTKDERELNIEPPQENIRTDLITWDWLIKFDKVQSGVKDLLTLIYTKNARKKFIKKIRELEDESLTEFINNPSKTSDTFDFSNYKSVDMHTKLQFQYKMVKQSWYKAVSADLIDDLFATIGNFSIMAAIHSIQLTKMGDDILVKLLEVSVYVKDTYDFYDSQYLGHWNREDVMFPFIYAQWVTVKDQEAAQAFQIFVENIDDFKTGRTYFPVNNSDYCAWREKHQQGGDMILFSDIKVYNPPRPFEIKIPLQELQ